MKIWLPEGNSAALFPVCCFLLLWYDCFVSSCHFLPFFKGLTSAVPGFPSPFHCLFSQPLQPPQILCVSEITDMANLWVSSWPVNVTTPHLSSTCRSLTGIFTNLSLIAQQFYCLSLISCYCNRCDFLSLSTLADGFPWQLCHTKDFVQVMKKKTIKKSMQPQTASKFGDNNERTHDRVWLQFTII